MRLQNSDKNNFMNNNVTYLIGAGASYNAIPTVESLNDSIKLFMDMMLKFDFKYVSKINDFYKINPKSIVEKFRFVVQEALNHRTVDTYAKKLFLQKRTEELNDLKAFLSLYFAFEQTFEKGKTLVSSGAGIVQDIDVIKYKNSIRKKFETQIDYRYDVFYATLLNEKLELPHNVNIISWNYDEQWEIALGEYLINYDSDSLASRVKLFPFENNKPQIFKLNGNANNVKLKNTAKKLKPLPFGDKFQNLLFAFDKYELNEFEFGLKFAWEASAHYKEMDDRVNKIVSATTELIVIGYSFPYFNRKIDRSILRNARMNLKEIRVQCLEKDYSSIHQSIKDVLEMDDVDANQIIQFHDDVSQFYIPNHCLI